VILIEGTTAVEATITKNTGSNPVLTTKKIRVMYKIKAKYLGMVLKYSMKTGIDITGVYDKATWNKNGFKDIILEEV
jgi:hypothetical protein